MSSEEIEPELWKIFDLQREPDKDFWTEIRRKSELKHRDNSHLPSSFKKVIESGRYEAEPLYSAETIKQLIQNKRAEFNNGRSGEYPQKVLTELLEEVETA